MRKKWIILGSQESCVGWLHYRLTNFRTNTVANVYYSTVALNILSQTNDFSPINECTFIADTAYDVKEIYNTTGILNE